MDDVTEMTCGICLEESKDPLNLPCGHSFCDGCLNEWRSRYGVEDEMRTKCPICRARIPPSKEMVTTLLSLRAKKQSLKDNKRTSSEAYSTICRALRGAEKRVGEDWDGVTVLQDNNGKLTTAMPNYIGKAIGKGDIKSVLKWINANRTEDRVNATSSVETTNVPALCIAARYSQLALMSLLLQLGADVNLRNSFGCTVIDSLFSSSLLARESVSERTRLLLSWGAISFRGRVAQEKNISHTRTRQSVGVQARWKEVRDRQPFVTA